MQMLAWRPAFDSNFIPCGYAGRISAGGSLARSQSNYCYEAREKWLGNVGFVIGK